VKRSKTKEENKKKACCHVVQLTFIVADTTNDIPEPHVERSKSARFPRDGELSSTAFFH